MATALGPPPRAPKPKGAQPSHYHESYLEKKGPRDLDYRKFWAGLQGLTLYFYNSNRDVQHVEKLDLGTFVKLKDEPLREIHRDPGTHFSLVLRNQEVKFKVESLESREMWKGFILTVVELQVPSNLTLLPGHLYMLAEALAKEEARRALVTPPCFLKVSRLEAQLLLERYPDCGNLLLRPSGDGGGGVSVTTRQLLNGTPVVRHYKVNLEGPRYIIDVEEPFSCGSLDAVVNYFVSNTNKALVPFLLDEDYEKVLGYVDSNKENGESVWVAPSVPTAPGPPPTTGGSKKPPVVSTKPGGASDKLPPLPPMPRPPDQDDENYVIPIGDASDPKYENVAPPCRPVTAKPKKLAEAKFPKPLTVPKSEPKGPLNRKMAFPATGLADVRAELEEKLQRRRALEQQAGHSGGP
ncbi:signal-transducing adaptor protein 2 isoform X2 [Erinaceus europaeus]|uniref:Signal-transducing adaptor protein 2 isoform X2 n=1 Tax=Erinaceus europaeus TaxID=9365 RepID=A0A1S3WDM7_ERIEU|nr:signal-transducing adaptor protein 2 isoform X2 [Erinaceus europaeus]